MRPAVLTAAALALLLGQAAPARAALVFFTDRASFNAANPGLPVEGFENTTAGTTAFTGPLSSTSNIPGVFAPGAILPGVTFVDNPGPNGGELFLAGPGFQPGNPTRALGQNFPATDALDLLFSPGVAAVAFDIFQNFGGAAQSGIPQPYPVQVFGEGGLLLGSTVVTVPSGGSGFFGVFSTDPITRVSVNNLAAFDVIDDVAFGGSAAAVPEPASLALLGVGSLGAGWFARRRRAPAA